MQRNIDLSSVATGQSGQAVNGVAQRDRGCAAGGVLRDCIGGGEFEAVGPIATNTGMRKTMFLRDARQRLSGTVVLSMRQVSMLLPSVVTLVGTLVSAAKKVANFVTSSDWALAAKMMSLSCSCT